MTSSNERYATEQRAESENLSVNLSGIKTQFENRRDENLVTPQLSFKRTQDKTSFNRISKVNAKTQVGKILSTYCILLKHIFVI